MAKTKADAAAWRCEPAGGSTITNNFINICDEEPPGCANPPHASKCTALLDYAASVTCLGRNAIAVRAKIQEQNFQLGTPRKGARLMTTETLELLLNKLPPKARRAFGVPDIQHKLIACAELINAGCSVYLHKHGCETVYDGEILYKGWRDTIKRLWRVSYAQDATNRITTYTYPEEYKDSKGVVLGAEAGIVWSANFIYECANTKQLIKYYHVSLGSHPK